jgi:hypothetical protein
MATLLVSLLTALWGCAPPPVYDQISGIIVHTQTADGTDKRELSGDTLARAARCLASTEEISQAQSNPELIEAVILLQVKDRFGDRMFEFYTTENFKGNKGKYYKNNCIYTVIRGS